MYNIKNILQKIFPDMIAFRQDIHKFPELAWREYRTTAKIAELIESLGYTVHMGSEAINADARLSPPSADVCSREQARAIIQGARPDLVHKMENGLTGLWFDMPFMPNLACEPKITALRFDIDANDVQESHELEHIPYKEGFYSENPDIMHACGHDGHIGIGIGLILALHEMRNSKIADNFCGIIRFIFQPAEEIGQGAQAMLQAGVMNNVKDIVGIHLGIKAIKEDTLICGSSDFFANSTFNVNFYGQAAHSALAPHEGKNALLAAVSAVQSIYAISRHGEGQSRVNIGDFHAHGRANVIPQKAYFSGETRGITTEINQWILQEVERICESAAKMWNCSYDFNLTGTCLSAFSDAELAEDIFKAAQNIPNFKNIILNSKFYASEDFTWFMEHAQKNGGHASFIQLGINKISGHHTPCFDFHDRVMLNGVELLLNLILNRMEKGI